MRTLYAFHIYASNLEDLTYTIGGPLYDTPLCRRKRSLLYHSSANILKLKHLATIIANYFTFQLQCHSTQPGNNNPSPFPPLPRKHHYNLMHHSLHHLHDSCTIFSLQRIDNQSLHDLHHFFHFLFLKFFSKNYF